jgi:hypothetical protein
VVAKNLNNSLADKYIDSLNAKNFETQVKQFVKEIDPGTQVQTTDPANWKVDTARIKKKIKQADAFLKIENLLKPQEPTVKVNAADLLVFIHYMPEFKLQAFRVAAELKSQYNVQPTQAILNFTFNSEVKYFADADAANAGAISSTLNKLLAGSPGLTFPVQEYKQKTPFRQIEIWIGKYKPIDTKMIYQQAKINTKLIKQN